MAHITATIILFFISYIFVVLFIDIPFYFFLIGVSSNYIALPFLGLYLIPNSPVRVLTLIGFVFLIVLDLGSCILFSMQARPVRLEEIFLWLRTADPFFLSIFFKFGIPVCIVILSIHIIIFKIVICIPQKMCTVIALAFIAVLGFSACFAHCMERGAIQCISSPLSWVHTPIRLSNTLQRPKFKFAAAKKYRNDTTGWITKKATIPEAIGKNVIVIMMESQRACNIGYYGGDADFSPFLSSICQNNFVFTNYYASDTRTLGAIWSFVTGTPNFDSEVPLATYECPEAIRVGRFPDFQKAGYCIEAIPPGDVVYDNWDILFSKLGIKYWIDPWEVDQKDKAFWSSFGMPDENLYNVLLNRYLHREKKRKYFFYVLTVSNHYPYVLPLGRYEKNIRGGMQYADFALANLINALLGLPEEERPVIFITSDTSQFTEQKKSLKNFKIPGVLIMPNLYQGRYDEIFCHEDLLDFLYCVCVEKTYKFTQSHRRRFYFQPGWVEKDNACFFKSRYKRFGEWNLKIANEDIQDNAHLSNIFWGGGEE